MDLHGSVTDEEKTFVETWQNVAAGVNFIVQENRRGDEVPVSISGDRSFRLTTFDRMLTEDRIVDPRDNPFLNGSFRPVIVPATVSINTNPNAMSEDDIKRLFKASNVAWDEYMKVVTSPGTLKRMMDLAEQSDLSMRRYRELEGLYSKFTSAGKRMVSSNDPAVQAKIDSIAPIPGAAPASAVKSMGSTGVHRI
jgi:hypothetical protein